MKRIQVVLNSCVNDRTKDGKVFSTGPSVLTPYKLDTFFTTV
jgi:hypothetical protein